MKKDQWIWMPHPGHFICAKDCRFFLNTCVGKYIISTIGELWSDRQVREIHAKIHSPKWLISNYYLKGDDFDVAYFQQFGWGDIGCERKYETMVFKAKKSIEGKCCPYRIADPENIDFEGYNEAEIAYKGHMKMCNKWSLK